MNEIVGWIIEGLLVMAAFLGCYIMTTFGAFVSVAAILFARIWMGPFGLAPSWFSVVVIGVLSVAAFFINIRVPSWTEQLKEKHDLTKYGSVLGIITGFMASILIMFGISAPWFAYILIIIAIIVFHFGCVMLYDYNVRKEAKTSLKLATSETTSFLCSTLLNTTIFFFMLLCLYRGGGTVNVNVNVNAEVSASQDGEEGGTTIKTSARMNSDGSVSGQTSINDD